MNNVDKADRCPDAPSVQDLLDRETRPVPEILREERYSDMGSEPLDVSRYTSREFHELEKKHVWPKVWQMACREEEISHVGDFVVYEINDYSLIVVRSAEDRIRAFHNVCLHRGRKLSTGCGNVESFRCAYHGFNWTIDGELESAICDWDFPHLTKENMSLPDAKVDTWGGFVFVNLDTNAQPLAEYLGSMPEHFKNWRYETKYKVAHVAKRINANWKAALEAFIEAYHVVATHRQIMPQTGDANTQYDNYEGENFNRMITPFAVASPHLDPPPSEQEILESMTLGDTRVFAEEMPGLVVPEGMTARAYFSDILRQGVKEASGIDISSATDSEMLDAIQYFVFPNYFPWGGQAQNIIYRFRPWNDDPDWCFMEVMLLTDPPAGQPRPEPAEMHVLADDESWMEAPELGALCRIFDQDEDNLVEVQTGLKASVTGTVQLGNYQDSRIRDLHNLLDKYIAEGG